MNSFKALTANINKTKGSNKKIITASSCRHVKNLSEMSTICTPRSTHRAAFGPISMATAPAPPVGLALPVA